MREFYLSRSRVLFARRNLRGIRKYLSCTYLCILAAPKKRPYICCTDKAHLPRQRYAALIGECSFSTDKSLSPLNS